MQNVVPYNMKHNTELSPFKYILSIIGNPITLTRLFFVLIATLTGYWVGVDYVPSYGPQFTLGALMFSLMVVLFESACGILSAKNVALAVIGLTGGLVVAWFVYPTIPVAMFGDVNPETATAKAHTLCNLVFGYLGLMLCLKNSSRISFSRLNFILTSPNDRAKILDSSVIIDGRVKSLIDSGFLQGPLLVPACILRELQYIADSQDPQRKARGRRGLDTLDSIQKNNENVRIWEKEYPEAKEVDQKLIAAARDLNCEIITNDVNLQKVATLHQIRVLNINELAGMMKANVFVGDELMIHLVREGKENDQAVAYLEDGSMVVVEDARAFIGTSVSVQVTTIVPTQAGRLIFSKLTEANDDSNASNNGFSTSNRRSVPRT